ncbi:GtrA family protein [Wenxinia saemankumensis]|uniref:Putative flippase GtrA (Transmembrane translocase of bactoprenol-linked glucose) n=1 Tax=Wenxinia saemankumensis TaxID=1447782 RepID=A0A1M6CDJ5_9RHOB|nr:GtrA family protein [Wenxinia saemankumensis]SHI59067.1 Putative flippase GtrA (transmembrane translocase of bactoprenol-linked glucose) [Wenxinia saemankumensis]
MSAARSALSRRVDIAQMLRFGAVGLAATIVHAAAALAAQAALGLPDLAANLAGFAAAVGVSYLGHARVTFRRPGADAGQALRFLCVAGLALAVSSAITLAADRAGLDFALAMALVVLIVPPANYLAAKAWAFAGPVSAIERFSE